MMKHRYLSAVALLLGLLLNLGASAAEFREISWDDLVPAAAEFDDPFTRLDEDTLFELSLAVQIRDEIEADRKVSDETMANYKRRVEDLKEQGVDIDGLIAIRDKVAEERVAKTYLANNELDGKPVRIPGYLLPLEFTGDKVIQFLLVPYVGACIHTPPPPPNQIVFVTTETGYTTDGGLYAPIWVDGIMKTRQSKSNLSLVDGSASVPSSYTLEASSVQPYE